MKRQTKRRRAFTLIELIVVMAVIGILVLLAAPKFLGYTERAQETKHIHTAKVIETALEAYLTNGGLIPENLEVVDEATLESAVESKSLLGSNGIIVSTDGETYYELSYDFIKTLDVKLSANNKLFIEAMASSAPKAVYVSAKGVIILNKDKDIKGFTAPIEKLPNENNPIEISEIVTKDSAYTIVQSGWYNIEVVGAKGGGITAGGGTVTGEIYLNAGQVLSIVLGKPGTEGGIWGSGGYKEKGGSGGGGSSAVLMDGLLLIEARGQTGEAGYKDIYNGNIGNNLIGLGGLGYRKGSDGGNGGGLTKNNEGGFGGGTNWTDTSVTLITSSTSSTKDASVIINSIQK